MRKRARAFLGLLLTVVPLVCLAQRREGIYVPTGSKDGIPWSINENHTLIWGGAPYIPVGMHINGSATAVDLASSLGIKDVIVDLPANGIGWDETLSRLDKASIRYLIRIDSLAPMAQGFAVEPEAYRVAGITSPRTVTVDLPGVRSAFVVLASRRDGSIASAARVDVVGGRLSYFAKPGGQIEHVLLIYPETSSIEQPDYWEAFDHHRDEMLSSLKRHHPGSGLRGIVNPMGRTMAVSGQLRFIPTSMYFRIEFRDQIEKRYRSVSTTMRSWGMGSNDLITFEDLSRLVPLWQGTRGVGLLLDPTTNRTYTCDNKHSTIWADLTESVNAAGLRRFDRFVTSVRSIADVPVTQEWNGWAATYERPVPAIDGIGMRVMGTTPSALLESGSRATSSVLRWSTRGLLQATEIDLGNAPNAPTMLPQVLEVLGSLGSRGFFVRTDPSQASFGPLVKQISAEATKRMSDPVLASESIGAIFFPENARNPAAPQRLPGGKWWLPTPDDGNRVDLGSQFWAYQLKSKQGTFYAIWARHAGRYLIRMNEPKKAVFASLNGQDCDPKVTKNGVSVNLSEYPTIITGTDESPVPQVAYAETITHFDYLMAIASRSLQDIAEERMFFRDYINTFDRNPGGSFPQMQLQLHRLADKVGDVTTIEAERSGDQNFSESPYLPGCSGNSALVLRTPLPADEKGYFANFNVAVRSREEQEVWIAAAIPPERRDDVSLVVNGQVMRIAGPPTSLYGDGYGWYKLGTTRFAGGMVKVHIQVDGAGTSALAFDAIVLTPRPFTPDGISMPDPLPYPAITVKGQGEMPKKKRGRG